jgi:hypothetical protein
MNSQLATVLAVLAGEKLVLAVVLGILGGALILYWVWFRAASASIERSLLDLAQALRQSGGGWTAAKAATKDAQYIQPAVLSAWDETESRVVELNTFAGPRHAMLGLPRDIWSPGSLLGRRINSQLADAVPNLLVGIGLLMTFFFLTIAITEAMVPLKGATGTVSKEAIDNATSGLLGAAGAKFTTSLAGLLASILWTFFSKRWIARIGLACEELLRVLSGIVSPDAAELVFQTQINQADTSILKSNSQIGLVEKLLVEAEDQGDLVQKMTDLSEHRQTVIEELLEQARDQTGTLKRFETDLAVSIATAINTSFTPKFEEMTERLIGAIDGLSNRLGTMNQDALRKMTEDFSAMLQKMTDAELGQLKESLEKLSEKLSNAGAVVIDGAKEAGASFGKAATDLTTEVDKVALRLSAAATTLADTAETFDSSLIRLKETVDQASDSGGKGVEIFERAIKDGQQILVHLDTTGSTIRSASEALSQMSGRVGDAVDSIDEVATSQREVIADLKSAMPVVLHSINSVVATLKTTIDATESSMNGAKDAMTSVADTLGNTVSQITSGVTEYSRTVADLHQKMDNHFAKAVGSLGQQIESLEGGVEELSEALSSGLRRGG